jgi:hypothetical protein
MDRKGDSLGEIEELYIDPNHRMVAYSAVGMGGVLGLGETWHSVPYRAIDVRLTEDGPTFAMSVPRETLKTLPNYPSNETPDVDNLKWQTEMHAKYSLLPYWQYKHGLLRASELPGTEVNVEGATQPCTVKAVLVSRSGNGCRLLLESPVFSDEILCLPMKSFRITRRDDLTLKLVDGKTLGNAKRIAKDGWEKKVATLTPADAEADDRLILASTVIGKTLHNGANEALGEIEDLLLDPREGKLCYGIAGVGGFLGMGESLHAMPWSRVDAAANGRYEIAITEARLRKAPLFHANDWPKLNEDWLVELDTFYEATPESATP